MYKQFTVVGIGEDGYNKFASVAKDTAIQAENHARNNGVVHVTRTFMIKLSKYDDNRSFLIANTVGKKCPKCGKNIIKIGYMSDCDSLNISGFVVHEMKNVNSPFGSYQQAGEKCFLTDEEFDIIVDSQN